MSELATIPKESTLSMPVKAAQCFADYVELGPQRSLRKLLAKYVANGVKSPASIRQLERWSLDYAWQDRLKALAAGQIERASEYRAGTYVAISGEYYRRVVEEPAMRKVMKLESLNSIYDRVRPKESELLSSDQPASGNVLIQFVFNAVTERD